MKLKTIPIIGFALGIIIGNIISDSNDVVVSLFIFLTIMLGYLSGYYFHTNK